MGMSCMKSVRVPSVTIPSPYLCLLPGKSERDYNPMFHQILVRYQVLRFLVDFELVVMNCVTCQLQGVFLTCVKAHGDKDRS